MTSYLRRLLRAGAAYQLADAVSKVVALALLPIYTHHLTPADYGTAELMLTTIILVSIILRLGLGEALVRFHFLDTDPERRRKLARTATGSLFIATTLAAIAISLLADPISHALLDTDQPGVIRAAALGLWAFTNLELAYALLRVEENARAFATASLINVALTVLLTIYLVVIRDEGAVGLLLGNYVASAVVVIGLWWTQRDAFGFRPGGIDRAQLGPMLRFGLPTVPAEVSVFALFFIDRFWLFRFEDAAEAGLYSISVKLAGIVVFTVRAFQYAWPPLAYSIEDDAEASRVYARITTYYVLFTGVVVAGLVLLGRWLVRVFAAPEYFQAHEALPWVSLGWALYGLFLVLVAMAGRAQVTVRNAPAALVGLIVNVALLALLVPPLGIAGAGIALAGAYVVMLVVMWALIRNLFPVAFEWGRLARFTLVAGGIAVAGELLLPTSGAVGFITRALALAAIPPVLYAARFFRPGELLAARKLVLRARASVAG
ncbi:lipopolysaccharide biosynthesis protein [Solirubrobacter ginsenosidimutans]|uniref:Lipopolysaccharide biosynthesis protein n=1 Tax=Solirubrobacter ginsenosidimutans TaxID=490573 RepID=A0A9X3MV80_9ACTN|nr:lipopolysaccharide biosynthesis protein [Solirubrobacter ginsenosidimutans]MDA0161913.1 lipopolysaccharide biosynthesis protein [Solirubrobacter ginsenosidimutans]